MRSGKTKWRKNITGVKMCMSPACCSEYPMITAGADAEASSASSFLPSGAGTTIE